MSQDHVGGKKAAHFPVKGRNSEMPLFLFLQGHNLKKRRKVESLIMLALFIHCFRKKVQPIIHSKEKMQEWAEFGREPPSEDASF